jgi:hypothetical protein
MRGGAAVNILRLTLPVFNGRAIGHTPHSRILTRARRAGTHVGYVTALAHATSAPGTSALTARALGVLATRALTARAVTALTTRTPSARAADTPTAGASAGWALAQRVICLPPRINNLVIERTLLLTAGASFNAAVSLASAMS